MHVHMSMQACMQARAHCISLCSPALQRKRSMETRTATFGKATAALIPKTKRAGERIQFLMLPLLCICVQTADWPCLCCMHAQLADPPYCSHSACMHRWRVNLGQKYEIEKVTIWNRVDCCADRLSGAKIQVKNSKQVLAFLPSKKKGGHCTVLDSSLVRGRMVN